MRSSTVENGLALLIDLLSGDESLALASFSFDFLSLSDSSAGGESPDFLVVPFPSDRMYAVGEL